MAQDTLPIISLILQTILTTASLVVSTLAFLISLKTYHESKKPIIGMSLFENSTYICLSIQNHGDGEAKKINLQCYINDKQ